MGNLSALITGGTGYLGSSLARSLLKDRARVSLLLRQNSTLTEITDFASSVELHEHTGTTESISNIIAKVKPDVVFHLASLYQVDHELKDTDKLITSNFQFPMQVLEATVRNGVPYFVSAGSAAQHFNNEVYNPLCLYAAMKQAFEDIIDYYVKSFPISAVTLKIYDTYGPGDPRKKILHVLKDATITGKTVEMSSPNQELHLVHIDDITAAFKTALNLLSAKKVTGHKIFALPSKTPTTLSDLVKTYEKISGKTVPVKWNARGRNGMMEVPLWNNGTSLIEWTPRVSLEDGLMGIICSNKL